MKRGDPFLKWTLAAKAAVLVSATSTNPVTTTAAILGAMFLS